MRPFSNLSKLDLNTYTCNSVSDYFNVLYFSINISKKTIYNTLYYDLKFI